MLFVLAHDCRSDHEGCNGTKVTLFNASEAKDEESVCANIRGMFIGQDIWQLPVTGAYFQHGIH